MFDVIIAASDRAKKKITADAQGAAKAFVGGYRTSGREAAKSIDDVASGAEKADRKVVASADKRSKQQIAFEKSVRKAHEDSYRFYEAQEQKAANLKQKRGQDTRRSVVSATGTAAVGMARGALGIAGQFARGAGVNMELGSAVGRGVELHSKAADIVNQLKLNGKTPGANEANNLVKLSRDVGDAKGYGANDAMQVLADFQAKSSDLATGKAVLGDLAELAKATGTSFTDMGAAAGSVNSQLADGPDKAEKLLGIMRLVTAQTASGSVEMADFAKEMPKLAAAANSFGGKYEDNLGQLTALAQLAVKGGAGSANIAANSASNIGRDMGKKVNIKNWEKQGLSVFTDNDKKSNDYHKYIKSPEQLILDSLKKTGGRKDLMSQLWGNSSSKRAADAAGAIYNNAGGGNKGTAAVQAKFAEFSKTVSGDDVKAMAASKIDDTQAKVQRFNNAMDKAADEAAARVLPALEKLSPTLIDVAGGMSKLAGYAAENPVKAAVMGIGAAFAKEVAGVGLKSLLQSALASNMGGALGGVLAGAAVTFAVTEAYFSLKDKAHDDTANTDARTLNTTSALKAGVDRGTISKETMDNAAAEQLELQARIEAAVKSDDVQGGQTGLAGVGRRIGSGIANYASGGSYGQSFSAQSQAGSDKEQLDVLRDRLERMSDRQDTALKAISNGTLKVIVMNPDAIGGATKPGTTGPVPVR